MVTNSKPILEVKGLKQYFSVGGKSKVKAVDGVDFHIFPGETYGLVGESGSGKSTIGRSVIGLYTITAGEVTFLDQRIDGRRSREVDKMLRTKMQMIFQDPMASLNPRKKVIDIIAQGLDIHGLCASKEERDQRCIEILERVGLSREFANRYPHQFSGGQRQRIGIARALVMRPELVIADEAISALDVSIQAQIVQLMKDLQKELGLSYLFIAHDLSMVKYISDRIGVLHLGHLLETGTTDEIFSNPIHPYTRSLLSAIPRPNPVIEKHRQAIRYDYEQSGLDYNAGKLQQLEGTHQVLATDAELARFIKTAQEKPWTEPAHLISQEED
ncbi:MAG: ATP-binding cassette domain-containing protein [Eubacteriales bacterium]|nr:ATP-binding cassette domain-containing protein [Eubacteriales bacterium]